ncbi:MAG: 4Fe-4S dicluster domain-containing protein [bacterium]
MNSASVVGFCGTWREETHHGMKAKERKRAHITINAEECKGCCACVEFCPEKQIGVSKKLNTRGYFPAAVNGVRQRCTGCAVCQVVCPEMAIVVVRDG